MTGLALQWRRPGLGCFLSFLMGNATIRMGTCAEVTEGLTAEVSDAVYDQASEIFRVLSAPMRLRIIRCLCDGERSVGHLLTQVPTTQPNMSQHLNTLYRAGVLGKRRDGVQIFYRIVNDQVVALCRALCEQIAAESRRSR